MSELDEVWQRKSDDELIEAFRCLDEYGSDGQEAIRGELVRRGLSEPSTTPVSVREAEAVARLHRWLAGLVAAQWLSLIVMAFFSGPSDVGALLALVCVGVFLFAVVAVPVTGHTLMKRLGVESPGRLAVLMYMPLFSLLVVFGMRTFNGRWSKEHGLDVGLLGPSNECLQQLRNAERSAGRSSTVT